MTRVLAIDQGTSGTKALVVDDAGTVLAAVEETLRPAYLDGGAVEQDPDALLHSVLETGRRAVEAAGGGVDAVALANQGETVLAWDRATGTPLTPAIVWQDRRAESVCARLSDQADELASATGLVLDPYFSAPKMRWLRDELTRDGVVTTTDAWLVHQLCGAFVTDASTASRSMLTRLGSPGWDTDLLDRFGLGEEPLPEIVACDVAVGETGAFGGSVPVAGLVVDQQAALLAEACLDAGSAKCTFGTGAFLLAQLGERAVRSAEGLATSVAWTLRDTTSYCVDGQVYTAGSAVRWAIELGLVTSADQLDATAGGDSDGVVCVPALAGLAAPWWDAGATATFAGMGLRHGRGHLVRALLEGIAAQVAVLAAVVDRDLGQPLRRLRVDGGLTRSTVLMQAVADLAQVPVEVYPSAHATALGAAACARLAMEPDVPVAEVVSGWQPERAYEPQWSADRASSHLERWHSVVTASRAAGA